MIRVAICAPSASFPAELVVPVMEIAARFADVELHFHPQCFASEGHFAGNDDLRRDALIECANDPGFDAVWFARGGYGSNRIAADAIARFAPSAQDKIFMGSSDGGYLLGALYRAGIGHPVHAPMPLDVKRDRGGEAIARVLAWLSGEAEGLEPSLGGEPAAAFNLMTLAMLTGTSIMPDLSGHVLMVEEVSEHLYAVDRLFFHLAETLPKDLAGIRLGRVSDVPENDRPFGETADQIVRRWCSHAGIPFLGHADIGHDHANRIVPFGAAGRALPGGILTRPLGKEGAGQ